MNILLDNTDLFMNFIRLVFWSLFRKPKLLPMAVTFSIYGFHFRKTFERHFRTLKRSGVA